MRRMGALDRIIQKMKITRQFNNCRDSDKNQKGAAGKRENGDVGKQGQKHV
jgi:hypothetical protein